MVHKKKKLAPTALQENEKCCMICPDCQTIPAGRQARTAGGSPKTGLGCDKKRNAPA